MTMIPVILSPTDRTMTGTVLSNGNLTAKMVGQTGGSFIRSSKGHNKGKHYWEMTIDESNANSLMIGISDSTVGYVTSSNLLRIYYSSNGNKYPENVAYGSPYSVADVIGVALDLDNGQLEFYKNGVSQGVSHNDINSINDLKYAYFAYGTSNTSSSSTFTVNFGATPFKYPVPSGYRAYNNETIDKTLIFSNGEYKKYRKGNDLYSVPKSNITPTMTENSNPFTVTADNYANSDEPWKVFQAKTASRPFWFATSTKPTNGHWLLIDMNTPRLIGRIGLSSVSISSGNSIGIRNWKLYGSNDGLSFEEIFGAEHMRDATVQYYETGAIKEYRYLRINVLDIYTGGSATADHALIQQVELYEYSLTDVVPPSWRTVSPTLPSLTQFQEEGMDNLSILDRKVQTVLGNPFKMTNEVLGEGKVFKGTVDLKKYFDLRKLEVK